MEIKNLRQLVAAAARKSTGVNFSDAQSAARNALLEHFGLDANSSVREVLRHKDAMFGIIEEVLEEIIPAELQTRVGDFAEIKTFGRDESVKFTIKTLGKNRVARSIVKGARGGLYRAHRLDGRELMVTTEVWTVGYQITLEELLSGKRTIAELVDLIATGYVEKIYIEVVKALRATFATLPANNKHSANGLVEVELQNVIRTVSAYGTPVIIGFESEVQKLLNVAGAVNVINPNIAAADLDEIRNNGRVSIYRGKSIIVLPNYFMDETNEEWMFKEQDLFILPIGEKPVKVAFQGEMYTQENQQVAGGVEYSAHRMMGIAILFNNHIGLYRDLDNTVGLN